MSKVIDLMNYNYLNENATNESDLPKIALEIVKTSLTNGSYADMRGVFETEVLPASCFNDPERYRGMDNVINVISALNKEYSKTETEFEEIPSKTR